MVSPVSNSKMTNAYIPMEKTYIPKEVLDGLRGYGGTVLYNFFVAFSERVFSMNTYVCSNEKCENEVEAESKEQIPSFCGLCGGEMVSENEKKFREWEKIQDSVDREGGLNGPG